MKTLKETNFLFKSIICTFVVVINSTLLDAQTIIVNSTNYKQTIDMMGGDMERSSIAIQNAQNKEEIINWGFGDIAFNYCRVQFDKKQELIEGVKNWAFYDKQVATMQQIKVVNPDIKFFATMRTDYDGFGDENNMPDWIVDYGATRKIELEKYGKFLADYLEYMDDQGVTIHTLSITKEWTSYVYASRADKIITALKNECTSRNIPYPFISDQGFWSISQGINYIDDVAARGSINQYDSFCSHDYQNEGDTKWATIIAKANALGKKLYNDEFSTGSGAATYGVEPAISKPIGVYIKKAVAYEAGLSGEIFFEIWSRGINRETRSIYYPANGTGRRVRGYYIMKQFANNILDSKYITTSTLSMPNVYTMSFRKDDKVVLWVINKSSTSYSSVPIIIDGAYINNSVSNAYWTNSTDISGASVSYTPTGNSFSPVIEGESMNCFIFDVTDDPDSEYCSQSVSQPSNLESGINYKYYEGAWDVIPNFDSMAPVKTGVLSSVNLSPADIVDNYGFLYEGYLNIATEGDYTFYTTSDDGSKLYIDDFLVVTNDGKHGAIEASGVLCLEAGYHKIRVEYFEATGGSSLEVMYEGPNIAKTTISDLYYDNVQNLAVAHGTATQSTDRLNDGFAPNAIDGNTNGVWSSGSVTHTGANATLDPEPWWQVDLGANYRIETINIFNRTDCCGDRLSDFTVEVLDSNGNVTFTQFFASYPDPSITITTGGVAGSVVRISKTSSTALSLAEVEVYGVDAILSNKKFESINNISIYPNPTNSIITIANSGDSVVEIYDIVGKLMLKESIKSNKQTVDINNFPSGLYFIRIIHDSSILSKKIIKN